MTVESLGLPGVALLRAPRHADARGHLTELWNPERIPRELRPPGPWVHANLTTTAPGALRGLHLQHPTAQAKLLRVISGAVFDVVVDLRPHSPTCGRWVTRQLAADGSALLVPRGCAHGFCVPDDGEPAEVLYLLDQPYRPEEGLTLRYDALPIPWPVSAPILSKKDQDGLPLGVLMQRLSR